MEGPFIWYITWSSKFSWGLDPSRAESCSSSTKNSWESLEQKVMETSGPDPFSGKESAEKQKGKSSKKESF